jgi:hypothetical protein
MSNAVAALAVLAVLGLTPFAVKAQTVPSVSDGQVTLGTSGVSGIQSEGGLGFNGQTDFVGGVQPGMAESGGGYVSTSDSSTINPTLSNGNLTATTTGNTIANQSSSITDANIAAGQSGSTSNDVFGESVTDAAMDTGIPNLVAGETTVTTTSPGVGDESGKSTTVTTINGPNLGW